jgi:uracil-DNA glycosylase
MSTLPVAEPGSAQRRDEVLRELNLYPLWQRRMPAIAGTDEAVVPAPAAVEAAGSKPDPAEADTAHPDWAELRKRVKACAACSLRAGSTQTVFGTGDENADWLFVGSWPSEDDDAQGEPFAGQAGQLLDNMLAAIRLKRGVNVYLANIVKCTGSIRRAPQADQIAQCAFYLTRQIQLLQPKVIVALGHAAATALLGEDREWNSLLGTVHEYRCMENLQTRRPIPLIITHHPAALLLAPLNKAQTWRDLCLARDTMREKIS